MAYVVFFPVLLRAIILIQKLKYVRASMTIESKDKSKKNFMLKINIFLHKTASITL